MDSNLNPGFNPSLEAVDVKSAYVYLPEEYGYKLILNTNWLSTDSMLKGMSIFGEYLISSWSVSNGDLNNLDKTFPLLLIIKPWIWISNPRSLSIFFLVSFISQVPALTLPLDKIWPSVT